MRAMISLAAAMTMAAALCTAAQPDKSAPPETQPAPTTKPADTKPADPKTPPPVPPAAAEPGKTAPPEAAPATPKLPFEGLAVVNRKELEGGLLVEDLKLGDGYEIKPLDYVVAHYHGTLKDGGKVFDSSYLKGGKPLAFPLAAVIPGWQKGVPGMKVGGIRRLTVPWQMAYGEQGSPPDIGPKADLVFVIDMKDAVQAEDVKVGDGEAVSEVAVVATAQTITTADGKVVDSCTAAKPYLWLPGEMPGMDAGLRGMKVGGKRRIRIPADYSNTPPALQVSRPSGVPLTVEVEVISVRNLPRR